MSAGSPIDLVDEAAVRLLELDRRVQEPALARAALLQPQLEVEDGLARHPAARAQAGSERRAADVHLGRDRYSGLA